MTDELARARVNRAESNLKVSPVDLLRAMALDIERGDIQVDGVVISYAYRPDTEPWVYGTYRAGLTSDQELTVLEVSRYRLLKKWAGG